MDQSVSTSGSDAGGSGNGSGSDSPSKDKLFDPSIDMLIDDFDDERTLEEEEALAAEETSDPSAELSNLEREGNMPLEQLLALYGYQSNPEGNDMISESEEEEIQIQDEDDDDICEPMLEKERSPTPPRHSKLSILYEPMVDDADDSRNLRSVSRLSEDEEDGSGAEDDEYRKVRKTIMVGSDYQAQIPEGLHCYDGTPPYENEDQLMWSPRDNDNIEEYLKQANELCEQPPVQNENIYKDDEEALLILKQCDYNTKEALKRLKVTPQAAPSPTAESINNMIWSEEESRNVESGQRAQGKDPDQNQQNEVND